MKKTFRFSAILFVILTLTALLFSCADNRKTITVRFMVDGKTYKTVETDRSGCVDMPDDPVKDGHLFDGWYLDEGEWDEPFEADTLVGKKLKINVKVYARFVLDTPDLRLDGFDRNTRGEYGDAYYGELRVSDTADVSICDLSDMIVLKNGATATLEEAKGAYDTDLDIGAAPLTIGNNLFDLKVTDSDGNTVTYRIVILAWCEHTVKFLNHDGTVYKTETVKTCDAVNEPKAPTRRGYKFLGWVDEAGSKFDFYSKITRDVVLTAKWDIAYTPQPEPQLNWDTTEILFEMNVNSNNGELSSGLKRYYAGEDGSTDEIDDLIKERNDAAYSTAKVSIRYSYVGENDANFAWGKNADAIYAKAASAGQNNPDMYCHFAYDMVNASIKGSFANLYSRSYDSNGNGLGENYFRFTMADYYYDAIDFFDPEAGEGYFSEYMYSLSLSRGKAYCLASNYCTDVIRSMVVIPVNVALLGEVNLETSDKIVDIDGNGVYDLSDFYSTVWDGDWNYEMLADISSAIYQNTNTSNDSRNGTTTLGDVIGFAAGTGSSLTASALIYTTNVSFIDRSTVSYYDANENLKAFTDALNTLIGENLNNGICTVSRSDAQAFGVTASDSDLLAIRQEFAKNNNILFGGVVMLGSLELRDYQEMPEGFGIAPVPVYKDGIEYKTLVHNLARIIGISVVAKDEFEMATAFLNEVSTNSSAVLNKYYEANLASVVGSANIEMLTYIRNHASDCFDKTYEDMIAFYNNNGNIVTWHNYFTSQGYIVDDVDDIYLNFFTSRSALLREIKIAWDKLPS